MRAPRDRRFDPQPLSRHPGWSLAVALLFVGFAGIGRPRYGALTDVEEALVLGALLLLVAVWGWALGEVRRRPPVERGRWWIVVLVVLAAMVAMALDGIPGIETGWAARWSAALAVVGTVVVPTFGWRWILGAALVAQLRSPAYFGVLLIIVGLITAAGPLPDVLRELKPPRVRG